MLSKNYKMNFRLAHLFSFACFLVTISSQEFDEDTPVDILALKHVQINNFHGELTENMMKLFKNVEVLDFTQSNFTPVHESVLHAMPKLRKFTLSDSDLTRTAHDVEECCKNLKELEFRNSGFSAYPWEKLGDKWPLERIYMYNEKMPELKANILVDIKLKELTIEYSGVKTVDDGAFNGVNHLEKLSLKGNKIEKITKEMLAPLKSLKVLNLSGNLLEEFTTEKIPELPNLEKINVGHNPIKKFNLEGVKKLAPKLVQVDVSAIDNSVLGDLSKFKGIEFFSRIVG